MVMNPALVTAFQLKNILYLTAANVRGES